MPINIFGPPRPRCESLETGVKRKVVSGYLFAISLWQSTFQSAPNICVGSVGVPSECAFYFAQSLVVSCGQNETSNGKSFAQWNRLVFFSALSMRERTHTRTHPLAQSTLVKKERLLSLLLSFASAHKLTHTHKMFTRI